MVYLYGLSVIDVVIQEYGLILNIDVFFIGDLITISIFDGTD